MEQFIAEYIIPLAVRRGWASFCEIGASLGLGTDRLLGLPNASVTVVDPCLDSDLSVKFAGEPRVNVCRGLSLDVLPFLDEAFDCILLDGDHNWYTVQEELRLIRKRGLVKEGGVIFLDDVDWPYGRRDMYYQPEVIPESYRQEYAHRGIVRGRRELCPSGGLNRELCNAVSEGGPRNGVLTAVEDFLQDHRGEYRFFRLRKETGLGAILKKNSLALDSWFLAIASSSSAYNVVTWPRRFARTRAQFTYGFVKSILRRA